MNNRESTEIWKPHNLTLKNQNSKTWFNNDSTITEVRGLPAPNKSSFWKWVTLFCFLCILGNMFLTSIFLFHFSLSNQETLSLLRSLSVKLDTQQSKTVQDGNLMNLLSHFLESEMRMPMAKKSQNSIEEFQRLEITPPPSVCRCPTCIPSDPIPTNKDPVSLVNEVFSVNAKYEIKTTCIAPPIHVATLTIEGENGKAWEGRGKDKKRAKHEAAYKALLELKPEKAEEAEYVAEDYTPKCFNTGRY